jgi:hypothetical protein
MRFEAIARYAKSAERRVPRQRKRVNYFHRATFVRPKYMLHNQTAARR